MFVYELSGCGVDSRYSYLNVRYSYRYRYSYLNACFEQRATRNSGRYRVWTYSKTQMWHDKNTQLKTFLPLHTVLSNYFSYSRVLSDLSHFQPISFAYSRNLVKAIHWIKKGSLSFKLLTSHPQETSCLPNWFTILYMVIEEILSPTFVTEWTSIGYCEMSDFFLWLIFLVSSPPSLTTLGFQCHLYWHDLALSQL